MSKVIVTDHPLIQHKLTLMRKTTTGSKDFRQLLTEISMLMGYEVTRNLPLEDTEIETPIVKTKSKVISGKKIRNSTYIKSWFRNGRRIRNISSICKSRSRWTI